MKEIEEKVLCQKCNILLTKKTTLINMFFDMSTKSIKNGYKCPGCKSIVLFSS
jgi:hypothetical protein